MRQVEITLPEVAQWLSQWRLWFSRTIGERSIETTEPAIYVEREFKAGRSLSLVPTLPVAYAVFGSFGVPMAAVPFDKRTRAPFELDDPMFFGGRKFGPDLREVGIRYFDDLVGSWTELIADAIGEPEKIVEFLIAEAAERIDEINKDFGYYEGIPPAKRGTMATDYGDDVAIANADVDELGTFLGSKYLAATTIEKARKIVPEENWSIDFLGLPEDQVAGLRAIGVDSMGGFMANTETAAGKAALGKVLGLDGGTAAARDRELGAVANEAATAMAIGSIAHAPLLSLSKWKDVDATTSGKLIDAGFVSVEDVAAADPAALATAIGVAPAAATKMVTDAGTAARLNVKVSVVGADATVGGVLDRTLTELSGDVGSDARANAILSGITAGLARRNFR
jgi:hypothetical protein